MRTLPDVGRSRAGEQPQQGRLAASRGTQDRGELCGVDAQVDAIEDAELAVSPRAIAWLGTGSRFVCVAIIGVSLYFRARHALRMLLSSVATVLVPHIACGAEAEPVAKPMPKAEVKAKPVLSIPAAAPLVAFLGDSISAGIHLAEDDAFPRGRAAVALQGGREISSAQRGQFRRYDGWRIAPGGMVAQAEARGRRRRTRW